MKKTNTGAGSIDCGTMVKKSGISPIPLSGRQEKSGLAQSQEEKYRRIFENIQDVYYEIDFDGVILEISPSIENFFPFKQKDLIGRSIYDFYADRERRTLFLEKLLEDGRVHDFEIELKDGRGGFWICSITASILPGNKNHPAWIVGSLRDISRRKRNEERLRQREEELSIKSRNLEEVNTALKVLLQQRAEDRMEMEANVLTNVKMSILPYIEKLKEDTQSPRQRAYLELIEAQIKEIVSPFLHKLSQGCFDLTSQEIRVADLVKNGYSTKEIAGILCVSIKTVDYHRDNIRKKLDIKNQHTNLRLYLLKLS